MNYLLIVVLLLLMLSLLISVAMGRTLRTRRIELEYLRQYKDDILEETRLRGDARRRSFASDEVRAQPERIEPDDDPLRLF